jgi:4-diphosphocytidyl-2-C-methyl-D-erythritol kinase
LENYRVAVIKPDVHVSTQEAYAAVKPHAPIRRITEIIRQPISTWKDVLVNDFEESVFARYPEISEIKQTLYNQGAVYAAMSGSGSSVFGIFERKKEIDIGAWCPNYFTFL